MLNEEQRDRFRRQLLIPEIGEEGQERLEQALVLLVGLGGLGSISAYYLAAAGVGGLRIIDSDSVSMDNLNRQILHTTADLDRPKVESAAEKLHALNPGCRIDPVHGRLLYENGLGLARGCRLIMDATDNLPARQALNRISLERGIPFIYGGIKGWNGMASTFIPNRSACFACLFPPGRAPGDEEVPVLGPTAGVIASIQTLEAIRILLGLPSQLAGWLLQFRGLEMRFRNTRIDKNPQCPVCGQGERG